MTGTYRHVIDQKGRLFIPAKLRDELGDSFYVTKEVDNCLVVYPQDVWTEIEEKIAALPRSKARSLQRMIFGSAEKCEPDSQGRIVIPLPLREYAGLEKDVAIIGLSNRAEIWDAEKWDAINEEYTAESKRRKVLFGYGT
jgi:MraZ protein